MPNQFAIPALSALAHEGRLSVFRLLARRSPDLVTAGELHEALDLKPSTLSVYVGILTQAGLIRQVREGRFIRYGIELDATAALIEYLVADCGRGRPELLAGLAQNTPVPPPEDTDKIFNVLFVCTGNSARSIFAEAILTAEGQGRFRAFSGGTKPYGQLNPLAAEVLLSKGHDISGLRPKLLDSFFEVSAPKMDFVFTVCDQAANEECPPLPGQPVSAHWGMVDPVKIDGGPAEKALAFQQAYGRMQRRLRAFVALPLHSLSRLSLQHSLDEIGTSG